MSGFEASLKYPSLQILLGQQHVQGILHRLYFHRLKRVCLVRTRYSCDGKAELYYCCLEWQPTQLFLWEVCSWVVWIWSLLLDRDADNFSWRKNYWRKFTICPLGICSFLEVIITTTVTAALTMVFGVEVEEAYVLAVEVKLSRTNWSVTVLLNQNLSDVWTV